MKNSTKLALAIVVIAVFAGAAVYFGNNQLQKGSLSPLTYWETYTNDNYDFSIKYPKEWKFDRGYYDGKEGFFLTKSGARLGIFPTGGFEFDLPEYSSVQTLKEKIDNKNVTIKDYTLKGDGHFLTYSFTDSIPYWKNGRIDIAVDTKLDLVTLKAVAGTLNFFDMPIKIGPVGVSGGISVGGVVGKFAPIINLPKINLGKPVQVEITVKNYPPDPAVNLAEAYVLMYKVKPMAPGVYKGTFSSMQNTNKKGDPVKFTVQPGEIVDFIAFSKGNIPDGAKQKWIFNYPPYKNFSAEDGVTGKLCQINFLDASSKISANACVTSFNLIIADKKAETSAVINFTPTVTVPLQPIAQAPKETLPDLKIGKISTSFHKQSGNVWFFVEVRNEGDVNTCAKGFNVRLMGFNSKQQVFDAVLPKEISSTQAGKKEPIWEKDLCHYTTLDGVKGVNFVFPQPHFDFIKLQAFIDTNQKVKESDNFNNTKIVQGHLGWVEEEE